MLREDMKQVQTSKKTLTKKKPNEDTWTKINKEGIKFPKQADILDKIKINGNKWHR